MHIVLFYHSLCSDWNHGNAHFLRGVATELLARGHTVAIYEPQDGWSLSNLRAAHGEAAVGAFHAAYPLLHGTSYTLDRLDLDQALDGADLVLVHEWNDPRLVQRIGAHHAHNRGYRLLFHDTHHRSITDSASMAAYDLAHYDGVLAFGDAVRAVYLRAGWTQRAWTWHEAADIRVFQPQPLPDPDKSGDIVWIGNWGDEERTAELTTFLMEPIRALRLRARAYGVRYPVYARTVLAEAGIDYADWLPNYRVPQVFASFRLTIHIPRRPYVKQLPGIPTIRVFEALACGIPLVCAPWDDREGLFTPGKDFLIATNGTEMQRHLRTLLHDHDQACALAAHGLRTIHARHTCAHRVDQLLDIWHSLGVRRFEAQSAKRKAQSDQEA